MMMLPGIAPAETTGLVDDIRDAVQARHGLTIGHGTALILLSHIHLDADGSEDDLRARTRRWLKGGLDAGLAPGPLFDLGWLRRTRPADGDAEPLLTWLKSDGGWTTTPLLDEAYYLASNKDVAAAGMPAAQHFITHGIYQDRSPGDLIHKLRQAKPFSLAELCRRRGAPDLRGALGFDYRRFLPAEIDAVAELSLIIETMARPAIGLDPAAIIYLLALYEFLPSEGPDDQAWLDDWLAFVRSGERKDDIGGFCDMRTLERALVWIREERPRRGLPTAAFSEAEYLAVNTDLVRSEAWAFEHYILEGRFQGRRPNGFIDPVWYRAQRDVPQRADVYAHWAKSAKAGDKLVQCVTLHKSGTEPARSPLAQDVERSWLRQFDLSGLPASLANGELAAAIARVSAIEPLVADGAAPREVLVPNIRYESVGVSKRIRRGVRAALNHRDPDIVILTSSDASEAARAAVEDLTAAARARSWIPLIVTTDAHAEDARPTLPFTFDLGALLRDIPPPGATRLLCDLLYGLGTRTIVNIDSALAWEAIGTFGKALANTFEISCYVTPHGKGAAGAAASRFVATFEHVSQFVIDDEQLRRDVAGLHGLSPDDGKLGRSTELLERLDA